jgi:hypothetical protein
VRHHGPLVINLSKNFSGDQAFPSGKCFFCGKNISSAIKI